MLVLCRGLAYGYECYVVYPIFPYHAHFWKELDVLLYRYNTVDVGYK